MLGNIFLLSEVWTGQLEQVYREEYSFLYKMEDCSQGTTCKLVEGRYNFAEKYSRNPTDDMEEHYNSEKKP